MCQKSLNFTYAFKCYQQECKWLHFSWPTLYTVSSGTLNPSIPYHTQPLHILLSSAVVCAESHDKFMFLRSSLKVERHDVFLEIFHCKSYRVSFLLRWQILATCPSLKDSCNFIANRSHNTTSTCTKKRLVSRQTSVIYKNTLHGRRDRLPLLDKSSYLSTDGLCGFQNL